MAKARVELAGRWIGEGQPAFIIAEAGINHNGDMNRARRLIEEAKTAGADCVKFQTFKASRVVTRAAPKARYQTLVTPSGESQLEMLQAVELRPEQFAELKAHCDRLGILFLSTPYNFEDVDVLERLNVSAYKVASGQIIEHAFLRKIAKLGKPILLSTGMATLEEVTAAVEVIGACGNSKLILFQCTTDYPSRIEEANLRVIPALSERFGLPIGYSDHTIGNEASFAAIALGARVIEKHFTLDKNLPGPDHKSSIIPSGLRDLVQGIRKIEAALGNGKKAPTPTEIENSKGMRRSLATSKRVSRDAVFSAENLTFKRPTGGLRPELYDQVIGKRATRDIEADEILSQDMVNG